MMMKNFDESMKISYKLYWLYIPDHRYKILIIGGCGLGKTTVLLNLLNISD